MAFGRNLTAKEALEMLQSIDEADSGGEGETDDDNWSVGSSPDSYKGQERGKDGTVWTTVDHGENRGRRPSQNVLTEAEEPTAYAKRNIQDALSAFLCLVDPDMLKHIRVMGQTKSGSRILHEDKYIEARDVARYGGAGIPPWSQAWGRDSLESAWWPGCSSRDPAGQSPNERGEAIPQWAHHLQGEP
ncbi:hypothetical protein CRENBAI_023966 [Crenichthys baileyi]|uniref:Uncharacterized protein n=1 Tax=Crenichthys baileyi TaxID=28760 RepID=A0AAV9SP39_9TELE